MITKITKIIRKMKMKKNQVSLLKESSRLNKNQMESKN